MVSSNSSACVLALGFQRALQIVVDVEMVFQRAFAAAGDENELLDAGRARFVDRVLDQRAVDQRQHFLRHRLGRRQKARAETGDGKYGFADGATHLLSFFI